MSKIKANRFRLIKSYLFFTLTFLISFHSFSFPIVEAHSSVVTLYMEGNDEIVVVLMTDQYPEETSWELIDANSFEVLHRSAQDLISNTEYVDTFLVDTAICLGFRIFDTGEDGLGAEGFVQVFLNDDIVVDKPQFGSEYKSTLSCSEGLSCEVSVKLRSGSTQLEQVPNSWFTIRPIFDTYYSIRTISDCDTKLWLYENCESIHPTDQTGSIIYNDDLDGKNAGLSQIKLEGGETYILRIGEESGCPTESFVILTDLKLKEGCMDPTACNFDPLANLDSGDCVYADCHPDLIINQQVLEESLRLDTFEQSNECLIKEGCLQGYGRRDIIRFSTQIENIGDADYIIGAPEEDSRLFSEDNCHQHWHYLGYAEYLLFDGVGAPQPVGFKNGFCALDYRCEDESSYKYNCDYMGISAGCHDTYDSEYLCQWIDVTDVEDGVYTLVVRVNHNRAKDLFDRSELDYENNWAQICVELDRSQGPLAMHVLEDCPSYTDCLNIPFGITQLDCEGVCGGSAHFGDIDGDGSTTASDVIIYNQKIKDGDMPSDPCFDLDGSGDISIYDVVLLSDCIKYNNTSESDPLHTHCDFPRSIENISDTVLFSLSMDSDLSAAIQVDYQSNVNIKAVDLYLSNVKIDSVVSLVEGVDVIDLSFDDHLMVYLEDDKTAFEKTVKMEPLLNVFFSNRTEDESCLFGETEAINSKNEKTISKPSGSCLSFATTANFDVDISDAMDLYPNPASDELFLQIDNLQGDAVIEIRDQFGKLIKREKVSVQDQLSVDIASLSDGIYILQLQGKSSRLSSFFIKL